MFEFLSNQNSGFNKFLQNPATMQMAAGLLASPRDERFSQSLGRGMQMYQQGLLAQQNQAMQQQKAQLDRQALESQMALQKAQVEKYLADAQKIVANPGGDTPMNVKEYKFWLDLPTDIEREQYLLVKRANRPIDLGATYGVPSQVEPGKTTGTLVKSLTPGEEPSVKAAQTTASETAKLAVQLKLSPEVEGAVNTAVNQAKAIADDTTLAKSNAKALSVYETSMKGLVDGLSGTTTGPFLGIVPAITSSQQIADGAVAAMAPVLKQLFRSAGEGIFTDKDQELLLKMIPTRTDRPDARSAKLQNVDAIIRAKLSDTTKPSVGSKPTMEGWSIKRK